MGTRHRVEILGQINTDNPLASCFSEAKIDRRVALPQTPRNWKSFCDCVDEELKEYTRAANFYRWFAFIFFVLIFSFVTLNLIIGESFRRFFPIIIVFIIFTLISFFKIRSSIQRVRNSIKNICDSQSVGGVTYSIADEHWGGCAKPYNRRYYITVLLEDEEHQNIPVSSVVSANVETKPMLAAVTNPIAAPSDTLQTLPPPSTPSVVIASAPSIFDQLSANHK